MLKKESKEITRQSIVFLFAVAVMSVIIKLSVGAFGVGVGMGDMFFSTFQLGLLIFAVFMGISLFTSDDRCGGLEYLLTLPYSRLQLLKFKVLPRLLAALGCFAIYALLLHLTGNAGAAGADVIETWPFLLIFLSLFIIGMSMSAFFENIVMSSLMTFLVFGLFFGAVHLIYPAAVHVKLGEAAPMYLFSPFTTIFGVYWHQSVPFLYFAIFALLAGFLAAFIYAFKSFSLKSPRRFTKRYLKLLLPVVVVVMSISMIWAVSLVDFGRNYFYLTAENKLVEWNMITTKIHDTDGSREFPTDGIYFLFGGLEIDGKLIQKYYGSRLKNPCVIELDAANGKTKTLYTQKTNNSSIGYYFWEYKNKIAFFEVSRGSIRERNYRMVLVDRATSKYQKYTLPTNRPIRSSWIDFQVFGAGEVNGKRFWLVKESMHHTGDMLRVWEAGTVENIGESTFKPVFVNNLLICGEGQYISIRRLGEDGAFQQVKQLPGINRLRFFSSRSHRLNEQTLNDIYGGVVKNSPARAYEKLIRLNLETLEISEVKTGGTLHGWPHFHGNGNMYFFLCDWDNKSKKLYMRNLNHVDGNKLVKIRDFERFYPWSEDSYFGLYENGFLEKHHGKIMVYTFPEFQQIHFKDLK